MWVLMKPKGIRVRGGGKERRGGREEGDGSKRRGVGGGLPYKNDGGGGGLIGNFRKTHLKAPGIISFYGRCSGTPMGKNADPPPHTFAVGGQPCCPQQTATIYVVWSWRLKGCFAYASAVKGMRT